MRHQVSISAYSTTGASLHPAPPGGAAGFGWDDIVAPLNAKSGEEFDPASAYRCLGCNNWSLRHSGAAILKMRSNREGDVECGVVIHGAASRMNAKA